MPLALAPTLLLLAPAPLDALAAHDEIAGRLAAAALAANPSLAAQGHAVAALRAALDASAAWADPMLSVQFGGVPWDSWRLDQSPMAALELMLSQRLPVPGENALRAEAADARLAAGQERLAEAWLQLAGAVRQAYWSWVENHALRALTSRDHGLLAELRAALQARYASGADAKLELLRLDLELGALADLLDEFDLTERTLRARLNASLQRPPDAPLPTPAAGSSRASAASAHDLVSRVESTPAALPTLAALTTAARARRPLLRALARRAGAERAEAELAARLRWPMLEFWAGYHHRRPNAMDDGRDLIRLGLGLPLPIDWTGRSAAERSARLAQASALEAEHAAALAELEAELATTLASAQRAERKAATYRRSLLPQAQALLDTALAGYAQDRGSFAALIEARLRVLAIEREAVRAEVALAQARLRLETLSGGPLPAGPSREVP